MTPTPTWTDTTGYSRDQHGTIEPRSWTWTGADPRAPIEVIVHRHVAHAPTAWLLSCKQVGVSCLPLGRRGQVLSVADAQHAALAEVMERLDRMSEQVRKEMGE